MFFVLRYKTVNRFNDRKMRFRKEHIALVQKFHTEGKLLMGGALLEPNTAALLIFKCDSVEEVESFVEQDPYVQHKLVKKYKIRPWSVAIGGD